MALANGKRVKQVCRELGVSEQTYYRWRKEYGGMKVSQAKRLKALEKQNQRLRQAVADHTVARPNQELLLSWPYPRQRLGRCADTTKDADTPLLLALSQLDRYATFRAVGAIRVGSYCWLHSDLG